VRVVDKEHIAVAALSALAQQGKVSADLPAQAIAKYGISVDRVDIAAV